MTTSLSLALQHKAAAPVPASIRLVGGEFEVVSKLETMTYAQRAGLYVAWEWHRAFRFNSADMAFHPVQFEIYDIKPKGRGAALAEELRQMGLLQCHEGRYWLSPAGLKLVQSAVNSEVNP
ncbi:hypothetical protein [Rheinheimera sp.]|uniref:hypothetical protein n=1 Tax=Rheinheimera sp. TaxID=1869214 RepID=UPI0027343E14|nr:hypothetical protein [Rheinheimera sp.]MDP2715510.1 hypothetical protein [Rheinheimera sp.]